MHLYVCVCVQIVAYVCIVYLLMYKDKLNTWQHSAYNESIFEGSHAHCQSPIAADWNAASVLDAQSRMNGPEWPSLLHAQSCYCLKNELATIHCMIYSNWTRSTGWSQKKRVKQGQTTSFTCNFDFASETLLHVCFACLQLTNLWVFQVRCGQVNLSIPIPSTYRSIFETDRCPGLPKIQDPGGKRWNEDATPTVVGRSPGPWITAPNFKQRELNLCNKKTTWALYTYPTQGTLVDGKFVKKKSSQILKVRTSDVIQKKGWPKKGWSKGWHTKKGSCKHNKDRKASKTSRKNAALWQSTVPKLCLLVSKSLYLRS